MKTQAARDLLRMARELMAAEAPNLAPRLDRLVASVEESAKNMRFSWDKYKSDPMKYKPQLENLEEFAVALRSTSGSLLRALESTDAKIAAPDAGHPMVSGSPEFVGVRKALQTYELARDPDPRLRKLFAVLLSAMEAWEASKMKAARARRTPKL